VAAEQSSSAQLTLDRQDVLRGRSNLWGEGEAREGRGGKFFVRDRLSVCLPAQPPPEQRAKSRRPAALVAPGLWLLIGGYVIVDG